MKPSTIVNNQSVSNDVKASSFLPTVPNLVSPETPLSQINLDWSEKDLPERVRTKHVHRLHPYLGKFVPQLAEVFLRKYFVKGQTVLDPFCGSGTLLVQANELGINSIGYDISAFNTLLSDVKTHKYDVAEVEFEINDILSNMHQYQEGSLFKYRKQSDTWSLKSNKYLNSWYAPKALDSLLMFLDLIPKYKNKNLLKVILSRAARSARMIAHHELDFPKVPQTEPYQCRKHSRICRPTNDSFKFISRYCFDTVERIKEFSRVQTNAHVKVCNCDSRLAKTPLIHGIITSPPYVGLIDYHEQHNYAYNLLGLHDKREKEIGPASNGKSRNAINIYKEKIAQVFINAAKTMHKGGRFIVIAGDKHGLYGDIAEMANLQVEDTLIRHVNRRTGRRANKFYESIFIWKKR